LQGEVGIGHSGMLSELRSMQLATAFQQLVKCCLIWLIAAYKFFPDGWRHGDTWLLAYLFVKVIRPRDTEGAFSVFESSCYLLLPV